MLISPFHPLFLHPLATVAPLSLSLSLSHTHTHTLSLSLSLRYPSKSWQEIFKESVSDTSHLEHLTWLEYTASRHANQDPKVAVGVSCSPRQGCKDTFLDPHEVLRGWPHWDRYGGIDLYYYGPYGEPEHGSWTPRIWHMRDRPATVRGKSQFLKTSVLKFGPGVATFGDPSAFTNGERYYRIEAFTCKQFDDWGSKVWLKSPLASKVVAFGEPPALVFDVQLSGISGDWIDMSLAQDPEQQASCLGTLNSKPQTQNLKHTP